MSRTTSRTARVLAFEAHNPARALDWRWRLAGRSAKGDRKDRPGRAEPLMARAVRFRRRLARCRTAGRLAQLQRADPDLFQAHEFHRQGGWSRVLLEARLLAEVPIADIAQRHKLTEEAVHLYSRLFFDVLSRLNARDWLLTRAIGQARADETELQAAERIIKLFAHFMGPLILDLLAERVFDEQGQFRIDTPDLSTPEGRSTARLRLMVDARRAGNKSLRYLFELLPAVQQLGQIEAMERRQTPDPEQLFADIEAESARLGPAQIAPCDAAQQSTAAVTAETPETAGAGGVEEARRVG